METNNTDNDAGIDTCIDADIGIVEPYELPVEAVDTVNPGDESGSCHSFEPEPISSPSEIDLSGYNYDLVPTYKMIEDPDDQDTLFRIQFLQAFGITNDEYHPEIVSAVIDDLYERFYTNTGIREILESHPLYHSGIAPSSNTEDDQNDQGEVSLPGQTEVQAKTEEDTGNDDSPSPPAHQCSTKDNNSEMIFCMMFSFQLFDLFHTCLRHAKHKEEIPQSLRDEIANCFRTMF